MGLVFLSISPMKVEKAGYVTTQWAVQKHKKIRKNIFISYLRIQKVTFYWNQTSSQ
jgi:hypothetical protein